MCVCVCVCSSEAAACTELYEHVALCLVLRASRVQISTHRLMCGATFEAISAVLLVCDPSYRRFEGAQRLHLHGRAGQILGSEYESSTHLRNAGVHSLMFCGFTQSLLQMSASASDSRRLCR